MSEFRRASHAGGQRRFRSPRARLTPTACGRQVRSHKGFSRDPRRAPGFPRTCLREDIGRAQVRREFCKKRAADRAALIPYPQTLSSEALIRLIDVKADYMFVFID